MDYEKKYKEALKVIEDLYNVVRYQSSTDALLASQTIEKAFPELKETEGEKVIKWLTNLLSTMQYHHCDEDMEMGNKALSWLEKQGEQKTEIEYIYPKFRIGDVIEPIKPNGYHPPVRVLSIEKKTKSYYCESDDKKSFSSIPIRCEDEYKLVEQKSSWSEEDEEMKRTIISNLFILKKMYTKPEMQTDYNNMIEWLKSLKPNHWKPSERQMYFLNWVANVVLGDSLVEKEMSKDLNSLYEELKKL